MNYDPKTNTVQVTCRWCKEPKQISMNAVSLDSKVIIEKFTAWRNGTLIQQVFPTLDGDDRELLISQTCAQCWDKLFGEDDFEGAEDE